MTFEQHNELQLLEAIESEAETTQADLAARAGVAVGTVNWYLKRWTAKGYVKVKRINRWRWHYLLTPQGLAEKARLAAKYVEASMKLYRQTREDARELLRQVQQAGYQQVAIDGSGDIADICRLTCLEMGVVTVSLEKKGVPILAIQETKLSLIWPLSESQAGEKNNDPTGS